MGEFNLNLMDSNSSGSANFLSTILAAATLQITSIPTRVTNVTAFLIDKIFSTLSLKENSILVSDISDHFPIFLRFSFKQRKSNPAKVFDSYQTVRGNEL